MKKVYVMKSGSDYKIGVAENPSIREAILKTGNPRVTLVFESDPISNSYQIESLLHQKYADKSIGNEWFENLDEREVVASVKNHVEKYGKTEEQTTEVYQDKIQNLVDWMLRDKKAQIQKLDEEVSRINEENRVLALLLKDVGWTDAEIEELIKNAEASVAAK